ncbi:MAG TPA: AAA family ATPase [Opitutales bacterium]|jgi:predicted ATPase|nr:AAA family ATPase [Opitutales bacterium]
MLRTLELENFCSFRDLTTLDLTTSAKTPTDDSFAASLVGDQITVLSGVFGANASGKTNLLKGLAFLNFLMRNSYRNQEADEAIPVDSFMGREDTPSKLRIEFEGGSENYRYEVQVCHQQIHEERLSRRHKKTGSFRTLLHREQGEKGIVLNQPEPFTDLGALRQLLKDRPNASMIAAGLVTGRAEFKKVDAALGKIETNVNRMGKDDNSGQRVFDALKDCAHYLEQNAHFKEDVEERLKRADLGIAGFVIHTLDVPDKKTGEVKKVPFPFVIHESEGQQFEMSMAMESAGTKRLFLLLRSFLPVLMDGGIAVIDEMESDLHPHLIPLILDLFSDPDINPKRAQLLFTCHHVEILNTLSKEQVILVEKDAHCVSHAYRLSDIKGVRRDDNYFANYNAGRYGAVPEPDLI